MAFDNVQHLAKHFRKLLKREGIKARCRILPGSNDAIQVFVPRHDVEFTNEEQRQIRFMAVCNELTLTRGLPINVDQMTDPRGMEFHLPA